MKYLLLLSCLLVSFNSQAQSILWQKSIGCSAIESPSSYSLDIDGSYLIAGEFYDSCDITGSEHGSTDAWIIKLDTDGEKLWSKGMGGSLEDRCVKIIPYSGGGYFALGETASDIDDTLINNGVRDYWIVKLDDDGDVQWQKLYGGSGYEIPSDIIETDNGDLIIIGGTNSNDGDVSNLIGAFDVWVIRINNQGQLLWQKSYGSTGYEYASAIIKQSNGNYAIVGKAGNADNDISFMHSPNNDIWLFMIDDAGTLLMSKTYGSSSINVAYTLIQTQDGGYMIGGSTQGADMDATANYGEHDMWAIKLNDTGAIEWQKNYGGSYDDYIRGILETSDGGYLFTGSTESNDIDAIGMHGLNDILCIKTDNVGNILWKRTYGGISGESGYNIIRSFPDNSYLIGGVAHSDDGDVIGHNGNTDAWILRIGDSSILSISNNEPFSDNISVYPTITTGFINISLPNNSTAITTTITDITGKRVAHTVTKKNDHYAIALNDILPGLYFLQVHSANITSVFKIIRQ